MLLAERSRRTRSHRETNSEPHAERSTAQRKSALLRSGCFVMLALGIQRLVQQILEQAQQLRAVRQILRY